MLLKAFQTLEVPVFKFVSKQMIWKHKQFVFSFFLFLAFCFISNVCCCSFGILRSSIVREEEETIITYTLHYEIYKSEGDNNLGGKRVIRFMNEIRRHEWMSRNEKWMNEWNSKKPTHILHTAPTMNGPLPSDVCECMCACG